MSNNNPPAPPYSTRPNHDLSLPRTRAGPRPPARARQKACTNCVIAKARCDLERPSCSRCRVRGTGCDYATASSALVTHTIAEPLVAEMAPTTPGDGLSPYPTPTSNATDPTVAATDFPDPSPVGTISLRWLAAMLPPSTDPGARPPARAKHLSPTTIYYCSRYLRAYPLQLTGRSPPPFVHASHLGVGGPLANAVTLVHMAQTHASGSEALVGQTVASEMRAIMDRSQSYDAPTCLAAFQAYLLLALLAYFHLPTPTLVTIETLLHLQALADRTARLIPLALTGTPSREAYVLTESLRRTIFATCVFDDTWNAIAGIPVYVAEELGRLPAPGPRWLWEASAQGWDEGWEGYKKVWERLGGEEEEEPGMRLEELWGRGRMDAATREARVDEWVREADEFAGWVFAICEMGGSGRGAGEVPRAAT